MGYFRDEAGFGLGREVLVELVVVAFECFRFGGVSFFSFFFVNRFFFFFRILSDGDLRGGRRVEFCAIG